jgi:hypothetical protein
LSFAFVCGIPRTNQQRIWLLKSQEWLKADLWCVNSALCETLKSNYRVFPISLSWLEWINCRSDQINSEKPRLTSQREFMVHELLPISKPDRIASRYWDHHLQ